MEIYLDNSATTKPYKEVIDKMVYALDTDYANPSSLHRKGVEVEKNIKNTTPKKEWQRVLEQVKKNIVHSEIEAINQEINELDKKNQRTKDEEQRLDQLLEQIVQMQRQLKS